MEKGKPSNGVDFYWLKTMIKNPEIFFTNQQNVKIIYNQRGCGMVRVSLTAERDPKSQGDYSFGEETILR